MNRNTKLLIVIIASIVLVFGATAGFYMTEDNLRPVTWYGTVTVAQKTPYTVLTAGKTIDRSAGLIVDLTFSVDTRPTTLTATLTRVGVGAVQQGVLFKGASYWRWTFTLDSVAAGTNAYFVSFEGAHDIYSLYYDSFQFNIIGGTPTYPAPSITSRPLDVSMTKGANILVTWKYICQAGGFFTVQEGNTVLKDGNIAGSLQEQSVMFDAQNLTAGAHSLVFTVRDSASQSVADTVIITVAESTITTTTSPTTTTTTTTTGTSGTTSTTTTSDEKPEPYNYTYAILLGFGAILVIVLLLRRKR